MEKMHEINIKINEKLLLHSEQYTNWNKLDRYLNNRCIFNVSIYEFSGNNCQLMFTVADTNGITEKFLVCMLYDCEYNDYAKKRFRELVLAHKQKYVHAHTSSMELLATLFNVPKIISNDAWYKYRNNHVMPVIRKLSVNDTLHNYRDEILKNWRYLADHSSDLDSAWSLAGGRVEVFRNNETTFSVWITTTATRYDRKTLIEKLMNVKSDVDQIALDALCKDKAFIKLGLKPGYYKADKITLRKDRQLVYVFDLKDRIRELLKEKDVE